jgi:hypothetical protein
VLHDLVLWFLLTLTLLVALAGAAIAVFSWQLNRANRVAPDVETLAPMVWLWTPTQPARMHRRLRAAVAPVHDNVPKPVKKRPLKRPTQPPPSSPTADLSRTLVDQAVTLDQWIVNAARMPRPQRRVQMRSLQPQVIEVERLSARIVQHQRRVAAEATIPGAPVATPPAVLADLSHQLDLLDAAHHELQAIEQANGLLDPDELMRRTAPPRQAMPAGQPPPPQGRPVHVAPPQPAPAPRPVPASQPSPPRTSSPGTPTAG